MATPEIILNGLIHRDQNGVTTRGLLASTAIKTADGSILEAKLASMNAVMAGQTAAMVVADIAARNALSNMKPGDQAWVIDATADSTVSSGAAKYIYQSTEDGWVKTAEAESMDVVTTWDDVQGKPASSISDLDDAVAKKHSHANKADVLDKLSVVDSKLKLDGNDVGETRSWVSVVDSIPAIWPTDVHPGGLLLLTTE